MPRQPFLPTHRNAKYRFASNPFEEKPDLSALVGQCITLWTQVEVQLALLLSTIIGGNSEAAVAVFLSIQNSRAQRDALKAAGSTTLTGDRLDAFLAIVAVYQSLETHRNDLAHGVFAVSDEMPEHILWTDSTRLTQHTVGFLRDLDKNGAPPDSDTIVDHLFVYKKADFEGILRDMKELWQAIFNLSSSLRYPSNSLTDRLFEMLCEGPRIREALRRLREAR